MHTRTILFSHLAVTVFLILDFTRGVAGQTESCNLTPNAAFEQGTASTFDQWTLTQNNGIGTLSVSTYPSPVQSGSRAAMVSVRQSGDMYLNTPEPGTIPVSPSKAYKLSVRLKSDPGKIAGIRIIEWNGAIPQADRILAFNNGTGNWETVEGGFTTTAQTLTVSIRLSHIVPGSAGTGTFYWDDVMLWQDCADRCVDVRHYVGQTTPGFRQCSDAAGTFCMDAIKTPGGELLRGASNGAVDYVSHTLAGRAAVGIQKTFASATWQCFSNWDEACGAARTSPGQNAHFPPQPLPISIRLPVLQTLGTTGVAPGATLLHDWQTFGIRSFDPTSGTSGALSGTLFHRTWLYLLASYNFGGNIGTQSNVLVLEGESIGTGFCHDGFRGGARLERYMYVRGLGLLFAEGRDNTACASTPSAAACNGVYPTLNPSPALTLTNQLPGDLAIANNAPTSFDVVDWW